MPNKSELQALATELREAANILTGKADKADDVDLADAFVLLARVKVRRVLKALDARKVGE